MDLIRRIRWTNVARAAALACALALVVAWPQLRAKPPSLPAAPAIAETPPAPVERSREFGLEPAAPPSTPAPKAHDGAKRAKATPKRRAPRPSRRRKGARRTPAPARPTPARPAPARPAPPVTPPAPASPGSEFGFE